MNRRDRAIFFAATSTVVAAMGFGDHEGDTRFAWVVYFAILGALLYGMYRAVMWQDPDWKPQRHTRTHWTNDDEQVHQ